MYKLVKCGPERGLCIVFLKVVGERLMKDCSKRRLAVGVSGITDGEKLRKKLAEF